MKQRDPSELLPLTPLSFHILVALAAEENHGYGLMKAIKERTDGRIRPATGTVYLALQRLEDDALLEDSPRKRSAGVDPRRRYYRLTAFGRSVARAETERLASLLGIAKEADLWSKAATAALRGGSRRG